MQPPPIPIPRSTATGLGIAVAAVFTVFELIMALWTPVPGLLEAAVFGYAAVRLLKGDPWAGFGSALFVMALVEGFWLNIGWVQTAQLWAGLAFLTILFCIAALVLFRAGRALPPAPSRRLF